MNEVREVLTRKYISSFYRLEQLLKWGQIKIMPNPKSNQVKKISGLIELKDAPIIAGALDCKVDFLITLDRKDFMTVKLKNFLFPMIIATPQEFFQQYWK